MKTTILITLLIFVASITAHCQSKQLFSIGIDTSHIIFIMTKRDLVINLNDSIMVSINIVNKQLVANSPYTVKMNHHAILIYKKGVHIGSFAYYTLPFHLKNTIIQ